MVNFTITIDGTEYPCYQTMGASLRFKENTGLEVTQITETNISDFCKYLYFCIVSACAKEKIPFELSLMEFADSVSFEDVAAFGQKLADSMSGAQKGKGKEKKR